jgi:hypothetical protein
MAQTDPPLQVLTIFLLRDGIDPAKALKTTSSPQRIEIDRNHARFIKRTKARPPTWTRFLANRVYPKRFDRVMSAAAVLICALLNLQAIEQRFGLLTTLNLPGLSRS